MPWGRRESHAVSFRYFFPQSVLQQATSFSQDGVEDGAVAAEAKEGILLTSLQARHAMAGGRAGGGAPSAVPPSAPSSKKQGVSGESSVPGSSAVAQTTFPKDFRCAAPSPLPGPRVGRTRYR